MCTVANKRRTFLDALAPRERDAVAGSGTVVVLAAGDVLHQTRASIHDVFFPIDTVCSMTTAMQDGSEAEVALIGFEGLVGVSALLGGADRPWNEAAVQIGGEALRVPVTALRKQVDHCDRLRLLIERAAQALIVQTSQTAACNRFHSLEQRLARCLLSLHDRVPGDEIAMTHERLGAMLGSLRPGVTLAARDLQEQELISYTRGRIVVRDRAGLETAACECYEAVTSEYERLLGEDAALQLHEPGAVRDETLREVNSRLLEAAIHEQRAREDAETANDATARFFATLSHELRPPLAAILGWAELLQSGELDDATLTLAIETIRRNAEAQKQLVNEMFELARLRFGKTNLNLEPVDAADAIRLAEAISRPATDAHSVATTVTPGEPVLLSTGRHSSGGRRIL
jgi:signal transduction histidine kinase